jgi:hypothetical protein
MAPTRASSFLPTIKCSTCGHEIEISLMGDHVCTEAKIEGNLSLMPFAPRGLSPNAACPVPPVPPVPSTSFKSSYGNTLSDKYDRMPPSLDTAAASKCFAFTDPSSSSPSSLCNNVT